MRYVPKKVQTLATTASLDAEMRTRPPSYAGVVPIHTRPAGEISTRSRTAITDKSGNRSS